MSAYVTQTALTYQGSYWPNTPPVLAPAGFYWYEYGPVGREMNFYRAIPVGKRPSPADQLATLAKHRAIFAHGAPAGLERSLAEHGLVLPPSGLVNFGKNLLMWMFVISGVGVFWSLLGMKGRD